MWKKEKVDENSPKKKTRCAEREGSTVCSYRMVIVSIENERGKESEINEEKCYIDFWSCILPTGSIYNRTDRFYR